MPGTSADPSTGDGACRRVPNGPRRSRCAVAGSWRAPRAVGALTSQPRHLLRGGSAQDPRRLPSPHGPTLCRCAMDSTVSPDHTRPLPIAPSGARARYLERLVPTRRGRTARTLGGERSLCTAWPERPDASAPGGTRELGQASPGNSAGPRSASEARTLHAMDVLLRGTASTAPTRDRWRSLRVRHDPGDTCGTTWSGQTQGRQPASRRWRGVGPCCGSAPTQALGGHRRSRVERAAKWWRQRSCVPR